MFSFHISCVQYLALWAGFKQTFWLVKVEPHIVLFVCIIRKQKPSVFLNLLNFIDIIGI